MSLPDGYEERKALPVWDGVVLYFPDAIAAIAAVSLDGNDQHNPGDELHWARGKSMDQFNTAMRHMMDHGTGRRYDGKVRHLAKAAWRVLAALQLDIEKERLECQAATTPSTSNVSKRRPARSKSARSVTKLDTIWKKGDSFIKGMDATSITGRPLRVGDQTVLRTGESVHVTRIEPKGIWIRKAVPFSLPSLAGV